MLTPHEFVQAWGKEELFLFPSELLQDVAIPDRDKLFLLEAGLPRQVLLPYDRDCFQMLYPKNSSEKNGGESFYLCEKVGPFRLLGVCWYKSYINIDESANGNIIRYANENVFNMQDAAHIDFVNASVPQFAESLLACHLWVERVKDEYIDDEVKFFDRFGRDYKLYQNKAAASISWLEDELKRIDPRIFSQPSAYWLEVLEDSREMFWRV